MVDQPHVLVEIDGVPYINQEILTSMILMPLLVHGCYGGDTNRQLIDSLVITEQLCGD